jgi:hypothetical protein
MNEKNRGDITNQLQRSGFNSSNSAISNINGAISQGNVIGQSQLEALISGRTESAIATQNFDVLNPIGKATGNFYDAIKKTIETMDAAVKAQSLLAAATANLQETISGGEGSEKRKRSAYIAGTAIIKE